MKIPPVRDVEPDGAESASVRILSRDDLAGVEIHHGCGRVVRGDQRKHALAERKQAEKDRAIALRERDRALREASEALAARERAFQERDQAIAERDAAYNERDGVLNAYERGLPPKPPQPRFLPEEPERDELDMWMGRAVAGLIVLVFLVVLLQFFL